MSYAFTPETLGEHWGVSAATVRNLVREGRLRAFRVGRQIRIRREGIPDAMPTDLRPTGGVYILTAAGAVVYVGRSINLRLRLEVHRRSGRMFEASEVIPCDLATSIWLEGELIRTLKPVQNLLRYERRAQAAAVALESAGLGA